MKLNFRRLADSWPLRIALGWLCLMTCGAFALVDLDRVQVLATQRYGSHGAAAVQQWRQMLAQARAQPEAAKLQAVNDFINRHVAFTDDAVTWGQPDYWATPLETLGRGKGDCEDFTIAKYVSLLQLGVPPAKLRLIYVRASIGGPGSGISQAHMVLGYFSSPSGEPLILDNMLDGIDPASERGDLTPVFSFNSQGLWAGGQQAAGDPTARLSRWRDLLARQREEGFE